VGFSLHVKIHLDSFPYHFLITHSCISSVAVECCTFTIVQQLKHLFFFNFFSGNRLWQLMFRYLCFMKEPGLVLATNTSKYLQENWFNCYWLDTVVSIVIVSFSACLCLLWESVTAVAANDFTEVCMNSVCVYIVWKIIWSLSRNRVTWV